LHHLLRSAAELDLNAMLIAGMFLSFTVCTRTGVDLVAKMRGVARGQDRSSTLIESRVSESLRSSARMTSKLTIRGSALGRSPSRLK
jgi:hypothetical protein